MNVGKSQLYSRKVGLINDTFFVTDKRQCYCEHKNKKFPENGIICGYNQNDVTRIGYCGTDGVCVGPLINDSISRRLPISRREDLCTHGKAKFHYLIYLFGIYSSKMSKKKMIFP